MKTFLIIALTVATVCNVSAQNEMELAYDDGDPNVTLQFAVDGAYFVTRFTPPDADASISSVRYYVADTSAGATCNLTIWQNVSDEPAIVIYGPVNIRATMLGWNEVDLAALMLKPGTDFYVGLSYDTISKMTIAAEDRAPVGRAYDTDC